MYGYVTICSYVFLSSVLMYIATYLLIYVDVVAINSQRVGQPLILQCSVTTIRDTNSRVDFVWNSNGVELERVEGAVGESSVNNSAIYTDHYIISQLTGADNNSLYICEVMISGNQLISFSGNITLNVTGKCNVLVMYINL